MGLTGRRARSTPKAEENLLPHRRAQRAATSMPDSSLVQRVGNALRSATKRQDTLLGRVSKRFALPQLYERYRKNFLTHGIDFLRGDPEVVFFGERSPAPITQPKPMYWGSSGSTSAASSRGPQVTELKM